MALNTADVHRRSFTRTVLPEARRRNMGVIGMKVYAAGELVEPQGPCSPADAMGYVLSLEGVSCAVIGCRTPDEVEANAAVARRFRSFSEERLHDLEERTRPEEAVYTSYKKAW